MSDETMETADEPEHADPGAPVLRACSRTPLLSSSLTTVSVKMNTVIAISVRIHRTYDFISPKYGVHPPSSSSS